MLLYHGSPYLLEHFKLTSAGEGTGIKYDYGVYPTESEASAVHYVQPHYADTWSSKMGGNHWVDPALIGRLFMELRDIGQPTCSLPADASAFLQRTKL